jgi:hypothetical protein
MRKLSDDEALEAVVLCIEGMTLVQVGHRFGRAESTIRDIVTGRSYRHVTGRDHKPGDCGCLLCVILQKAEINLAMAESALAIGGEGVNCRVRCARIGCSGWITCPAAAVMRRHGAALCGRCDTRRRGTGPVAGETGGAA